MGEQELANLSRRVHVIGCHTANHRRFTEGITPDTMFQELTQSRAWFVHSLGIVPRSFAWVGGENTSTYARDSRECIVSLGFEFIFITKSAPIIRDSDPCVLQRTMLDPWLSPEVFRMKIAGALRHGTPECPAQDRAGIQGCPDREKCRRKMSAGCQYGEEYFASIETMMAADVDPTPDTHPRPNGIVERRLAGCRDFMNRSV